MFFQYRTETCMAKFRAVLPETSTSSDRVLAAFCPWRVISVQSWQGWRMTEGDNACKTPGLTLHVSFLLRPSTRRFCEIPPYATNAALPCGRFHQFLAIFSTHDYTKILNSIDCTNSTSTHRIRRPIRDQVPSHSTARQGMT